jgi:hypothetical protein
MVPQASRRSELSTGGHDLDHLDQLDAIAALPDFAAA